MRNIIKNEKMSCEYRSLKTFPTAHENRSLALIMFAVIPKRLILAFSETKDSDLQKNKLE